MGSVSEARRITLIHTRPNPLFQEWLENLLDEAREKNSKLTAVLQEALESLAKYPLPVKTGSECAVLKGFDKKLCKFLDMRLEVYNSNLQQSQLNNAPNEVNRELSNGSDDRNARGVLRKGNKRSASGTNTDSTSQQDETDSYHSDKKLPKLSPVGSVSDTYPPNGCSDTTDTNSEQSSTQSRKTYKARYRSGSYAILVALLEYSKKNPNKPSLTKDQLIKEAQIHSEESFVRPKPGSFYTAWSNMSKLVSENLVIKNGRKNIEYSLTAKGMALAIEIFKENESRTSINDLIFNNDQCISTNSTVPMNKEMALATDIIKENEDRISVNELIFNNDQCLSTDSTVPVNDNNIEISEQQMQVNDIEVFEMVAGSFDVILLIDKKETSGLSNQNDPTVAQFMKYPDLNHEYRNLNVGDYTWIARHKVNREQEFILPYIVERKRMDDFGASIKDGRFKEQKFRLRKCDLNNVIYLVEEYGDNRHVGLPIGSLKQATANSRVHDGFKVHTTNSLNHSVRFLAMMTKRLTIEYKNNNLMGCSNKPNGEQLMVFNYFNKLSDKTKAITVTETFIKMLLQLKGMSVDKAVAITREYSTPRSLINAFNAFPKNAPHMLNLIKFGRHNRNVGPHISGSISRLFLPSN